MPQKILIIDDNRGVRESLEMLLLTEFDDVYTLSNPNTLISTIQQNQIDVVLLDMNFKTGINTGNEGLFWLKEIQKLDPSISVILITAYGDVELAVKAVKVGAFDFILKPWDNNKLLSTIDASIKLRKTKLENAKLQKTTYLLKNELNANSYSIIGQSDSIKSVMSMIEKVAKTDANIFITGENGTGKELVAREIHRLSKRKDEILVTVDMGAVSESLFESELFGYKKGAFTDAKEDRSGKFEAAQRGSLFLDEIGNLSLAMQAKILTALQNRTITKIGSHQAIPIDIRLISATNKDINKMVEDGEFREDLLYRINTINIELPPLRERGNDAILLAHFYLNKYAQKYGKPAFSLSDKAEKKLLSYNWPGNVRELQHCMEKVVILAEKSKLDEFSFSLNEEQETNSGGFQMGTLEEMEKKMIKASLKKAKGNMSMVAKNLGITRPTLYSKLKKYGL
ncbi:sigma-54 dependent transcriptional regulator [Lentimicrobium sp. S6]|uniref:sigma-54-dependent transcriptional regulator n=1 Tax=Lentimicrobium sp. S6 TaxID=2735872 RepID=UPI00155349C7|nr:sigma-54 dependent transcriptional regulator [Lentimicrobium sp. S6]NPD47702.1 sigma-54-dependent Fis family transcriptional regulator [Lentimicrobium sp. S6]